MTENLLLMTDSYKSSHFLQYPPGTKYVYSYIEARGGEWSHALVFGLQAFLKKYLRTRITQEMVEEAAEFFADHGEPFNREGWEYIVNELDGRLPLHIMAVPEGSLIPIKNVLATVVNTDPRCFWLTGYIETALLRGFWYPTTVATNSFFCKIEILRALQESCDNPMAEIMFRLHDFGARGVSSHESAEIGGMAHLVNFMGSDTVEGVIGARRYYGECMAGFSIPAAEHSTITAWGKASEFSAYENMLKHFAKPGSLVAVVSDSYDLDNAVNHIWGGSLKQQIIDSGATVIIRPDSGDPETVPTRTIANLGERFGYTVNSKGFRVLKYVRVIQGDGITYKTIPAIYRNLLAAGYSAENLALGMGGGLLQQVNRDTMKWAMKCSAVNINGVWFDVFKQPKDAPDKSSKKGRLALICENGVYRTVRPWDMLGAHTDLLVDAYVDGKLKGETTFGAVRLRASNALLGMI